MRRRNASDEPAKVSLPAGIATTAADTPTAPAGSVTVPANAARNASADFAFFDPRPNAYGDAAVGGDRNAAGDVEEVAAPRALPVERPGLRWPFLVASPRKVPNYRALGTELRKEDIAVTVVAEHPTPELSGATAFLA